MPTSTFHNLNDDKKQRIFDAAVKEFSIRRFTDASINQIIKNAGIPKGSFYQYFNDKEDIYLYMMEKIENEKHEIMSHIKVLNTDADIFEIGMEEMKAALEWAKFRPDYSRIGILMWSDNSKFIARFRATTIESVKKNIESDKERGLIKPEADSDLVADILITLILNESFFAGLDEDKYLKKLNDTIKILKEGIAVTKK
ncbi:TetR/AcrR family transcriptional regulator [Clostridium kluyveri]|uniref:TetR family transcriptional regulator n=1 Tax=Clostridium kluyveri TaxID=1534 RepID=A0A1L5FAJ0_CLOKL|nr:TetR/AcrR family transcriptional regulator [Clostridium kluyveri]APM39840.1 TetR family transcriptional regulator [Clostridium kluyveri]UZQ49999.1 TetR/AcrR family transcriptional regulator [Clostridium kluyveri]